MTPAAYIIDASVALNSQAAKTAVKMAVKVGKNPILKEKTAAAVPNMDQLNIKEVCTDKTTHELQFQQRRLKPHNLLSISQV